MIVDAERLPFVIVEHLHAAMIPVWSLPIGLCLRNDSDGLMVLDRYGTELVLIPWSAVLVDDGA